MLHSEKAQGALEYLLLIAGAILIVAIVIALLAGMTSQTKTTTNEHLNNFLGWANAASNNIHH